MEEKKYSIIGKVEIGTDEYRDLIETKAEAEKDRDDYRSKYWAEQNKVKEAESKIEELQVQHDKVSEFIKQDNERYQAYVKFIAGKEVEL